MKDLITQKKCKYGAIKKSNMANKSIGNIPACPL